MRRTTLLSAAHFALPFAALAQHLPAPFLSPCAGKSPGEACAVTSGNEAYGGGPSPTCNANCTISRCGDGIVNALAGEQCDDGGPTATCSATCARL